MKHSAPPSPLKPERFKRTVHVVRLDDFPHWEKVQNLIPLECQELMERMDAIQEKTYVPTEDLEEAALTASMFVYHANNTAINFHRSVMHQCAAITRTDAGYYQWQDKSLYVPSLDCFLNISHAPSGTEQKFMAPVSREITLSQIQKIQMARTFSPLS